MNRRDFLKSACVMIGAAILPLPKIAIATVKKGATCTLTLIELARRTCNKHLLDISEIMAETNEILADATWARKAKGE